MSNYKSPLRSVQVSLKAGELDPLLRMRTDTDALKDGAQLLRNVLVQSTGSVTRRPGTTLRNMLQRRSRLLEFEFDANERYIMAFQDDGLEIFDATGDLVKRFSDQPGVDKVPWETGTDFWEMGHVQKADVMILAHKTFPMTKVRRYKTSSGAISFAIEPFVFSTDTGVSVLNQPFFKYEATSVTMAVSATTVTASGSPDITVTCSKAIFTKAWIGERIRIYNKEVKITAVGTGTVATAKGRVMQKIETELGIAPLKYTQDSHVIEVTHALHGLASGATVTFSGAQGENNLGAGDINGPRTITVIDEDRYRFTAGGGDNDKAEDSIDGGGVSLKVSTTAPTRRWAEQVWSSRRGWPGAITIHENRLWLGGSTDNPTFLAASAVGQYFDFNVREGLEDESVQGTIATLSRIQYLVSGKVLQIFTENSEAIAETPQGQPITPANFKVVTQTYYGQYKYGTPRIFDGGTIFIQKHAKNIRELRYDFNTDSHASTPISVMASHMISTPNDLAVVNGTNTRPEQYCFVINGNQNVPIFHSIVSEKLAAWSMMTIATRPKGKSSTIPGTALVDSACVSGPDVWFSVRRGDNTSSRPYAYSLERLELDPLASQDAAAAGAYDPQVWLDCAEVFWRSGDTKMTTLKFGKGSTLRNRIYRDTTVTVYSLRSKYVGKLYSDSAGQVKLPKGLLTPIVAGFDYGITVRPHPPDIVMTDGPMTGEKRRILSTAVHLNASTSCAINGLETLGLVANQLPAAFTGKKKVRHLGYGIDPIVTITQPIPGPLTVLGMIMEVSI